MSNGKNLHKSINCAAGYTVIGIMLCIFAVFSVKVNVIDRAYVFTEVIMVITAMVFQIMLMVAVISGEYSERIQTPLFYGIIVSLFLSTVSSGFVYITSGIAKYSLFTFTMNKILHIYFQPQAGCISGCMLKAEIIIAKSSVR